jgi:hypothetical protein
MHAEKPCISAPTLDVISVEFIDEKNGGGLGLPATQETAEEEVVANGCGRAERQIVASTAASISRPPLPPSKTMACLSSVAAVHFNAGCRTCFSISVERAGILFITDDEIAGIGVRLAKKKRRCSRRRKRPISAQEE